MLATLRSATVKFSPTKNSRPAKESFSTLNGLFSNNYSICSMCARLFAACARGARGYSPNNDVLYCSAECPLLAPSGHRVGEFQCPLLGVKRTSLGHASMSAFDPKRTLEGLESRLLGNLAYDAILALVSRVSTRRELRRERVRSRCCLKTKNRSESRIGTTLAARSISSKSFSKASALWTETSRWSASSTSRNRR